MSLAAAEGPRNQRVDPMLDALSKEVLHSNLANRIVPDANAPIRFASFAKL